MRLLLCLCFLSLLACQQVDTEVQNELQQLKMQLQETEQALQKASNDEVTFIHTVFFWMKEGVNDEQKKAFEEGMAALAKVPTLYKVYSGPPAMTDREVVDNSYDYAWVCHFESKEDHDSYQVDPIHLDFIEKYKDLWEKVQVYDNTVSM
ncbi:MAG: Dabb family protein [Bacteroidota bacterium]